MVNLEIKIFCLKCVFLFGLFALFFRWWWQLVEDKEEWSDCQFLWMQWRRKEYTKYMKSLAQLQVDRVIASSPREKENGDEMTVAVTTTTTAVVVKKKTALEYSRKKGETYQKLTRRLLNDNDFALIDQNLVQNKVNNDVMLQLGWLIRFLLIFLSVRLFHH